MGHNAPPALRCNYMQLRLHPSARICPDLNSLPNNKIFDRTKLKAFADDRKNVAGKMKFVLGMIKNIVGKGEKCWLPAFSPFPTMFSKGFFFRVVKSRDCMVMG